MANPIDLAHRLKSRDPDEVLVALNELMDAQKDCASRQMRRMESLPTETIPDNHSWDQYIQNPLPGPYFSEVQYSRVRRRSRTSFILAKINDLIQEYGNLEHRFVVCPWTDDIFYAPNGRQAGTELICPVAYEELAAECNECGRIFNRRHMLCEEGEYTCNACIEARPTLFSTGYSGDVLEHLKGFRSFPGEILPARPLWLGVELEVEPRDRRSGYGKALRADLGSLCILKPDGSLSDYGVELCSVPATLAYHRTAWDSFFANSAKLVKGWHADSCGMHVHMDIRAISDLCLGKMLVFVNSQHNRSFISNISGRDPTMHCRREEKSIAHGKTAKRGTDHYDALSVSAKNNNKTVEMRIFRSNVAKFGFFKNLEFCDALVRFCRQTGEESLKWEDFVLWMKKGRAYPELHGWLVKEKLLEVSRYQSLIQNFAEAT